MANLRTRIHILAKNKLHATYSTIIGLPTEAQEDINKTLDLLLWVHRNHRQSNYTLGVYIPFPGSKLYDFAKMNGFKPPQRTEDWGYFDRWEGFRSPWIDAKKANLMRQYIKFMGLNLPLVGKFFEFRLRHKIFILPIDEKILQFLVNQSIDEKNAFGRGIRNFYAPISKYLNR